MIYNKKSLSKYQLYSLTYYIMKKSFWILSLLWILVLSWCGSSNVVEYNDSFVEIVKECTDANQTLFQNFNAEQATIDSIEQSIQENISICKWAQEKAVKIWNYEKDSSLKDAVVELLTSEVEYLQKFASTKPYRNIDNLSDEDKEAYNWITSELNELQTVLNQQFTSLQDVQEAFATKHWLKLE